MRTNVAFLRAVNVGRRRVSNPRLVEVVEGLGHTGVWAFIASGNIVFDSADRREDLERDIAAALEATYGFEITTMVRTIDELRERLADNPFPLDDGDTHLVVFLAREPASAEQAALESLSGEHDTLRVSGRDVNWRIRGTAMDSALSTRHWEKVLGEASSTSRNVTMLTRLVSKIDS